MAYFKWSLIRFLGINKNQKELKYSWNVHFHSFQKIILVEPCIKLNILILIKLDLVCWLTDPKHLSTPNFFQKKTLNTISNEKCTFKWIFNFFPRCFGKGERMRTTGNIWYILQHFDRRCWCLSRLANLSFNLFWFCIDDHKEIIILKWTKIIYVNFLPVMFKFWLWMQTGILIYGRTWFSRGTFRIWTNHSVSLSMDFQYT